jgi:hypothetical protein
MKKIVFILLAFLVLASCEKDYLDINENPNAPTFAPNRMVLPGVQVDIARWMTIGDGIGGIATVYAHHGTTREHWDDYGVLGTSFYNQTNWSRLYSTITNINLLIEQAEEWDELIYAGIGKLLKAYTYTIMVDIWADIPYTQAHNLGEFRAPQFDDGKEIYRAMFEMIDDAIADLQNTESENVLRPGADDLIYGGSVDKWIRFANTLKLKMYTQVRKTDLWNQAAVNALLAGNMLMASQADSFMLRFGSSNAPDDRHPGFIDDYEGGQIGWYNSPWLYETMMGLNPVMYSGVVDPRTPYYFYMQLVAGQETQNPAEYVHDSQYGRFVSIWFGSIGPNRDFDQRVSASTLGIYPVGGRFSNPNDNAAARLEARGANATGAGVQRMLTYVDRLFLELELKQLGLVAGSEQTGINALFRLAVEEAFRQVNVCVAGAIHSTQAAAGVVPVLNPLDGTVDAPGLSRAYVNAAYNRFVAAPAGEKLQHIMTQKWLSNFGAPVDAYTDYRRTGFPVIHDPNTDGNANTQRLRNYVRSFPWSQNELTLNPNAPDQKDPATYRVFWDVQ